MRESVGYQIILEEGAVAAQRKALLRQGRKRFGAPTEVVTAAINGTADLPRLERMVDRVLDVSSWQELLDTP